MASMTQFSAPLPAQSNTTATASAAGISATAKSSGAWLQPQLPRWRSASGAAMYGSVRCCSWRWRCTALHLAAALAAPLSARSLSAAATLLAQQRCIFARAAASLSAASFLSAILRARYAAARCAPRCALPCCLLPRLYNYLHRAMPLAPRAATALCCSRAPRRRACAAPTALAPRFAAAARAARCRASALGESYLSAENSTTA